MTFPHHLLVTIKIIAHDAIDFVHVIDIIQIFQATAKNFCSNWQHHFLRLFYLHLIDCNVVFRCCSREHHHHVIYLIQFYSLIYSLNDDVRFSTEVRSYRKRRKELIEFLRAVARIDKIRWQVFVWMNQISVNCFCIC